MPIDFDFDPDDDLEAAVFRCTDCGARREITKPGIEGSPMATAHCESCQGSRVHRRVSE